MTAIDLMTREEILALNAVLGVRVTALEGGLHIVADTLRAIGAFGDRMVCRDAADQIDRLLAAPAEATPPAPGSV